MFTMMSSIPLKIKYNLNSDEQEAIKLIEYYEKLRKQFSINDINLIYSGNYDPRYFKFFKSFLKLYCMSKEKNTLIPDPRLFILSQFETIKSETTNGIVYCPPQYLFSKYAWKRYRRYINEMYINKCLKDDESLIKENTYQILIELNNTKSIISNLLLNKYRIQKFNTKYFFCNIDNWFYINNNIVSKYFLSISKVYSMIINNVNIPSKFKKDLPNNLDIYKYQIINNKHLKQESIKLFGEEIEV